MSAGEYEHASRNTLDDNMSQYIIRRRYFLDPTATAPPGCTECFLLHSVDGREYTLLTREQADALDASARRRAIRMFTPHPVELWPQTRVRADVVNL